MARLKKGSAEAKAWGKKMRALRNSRSRASSPRRITTTRRKTNMGKKKNHGGGKSFLKTAFKLIRIGALAAPAVGGALANAPARDKLEGIFSLYTGYHPRYNDFRFDRLVQGWTPFIAATLVTYGVQKLSGLLRRI